LYLAWRVSKIKMINDHGLTVFNFYKIFLLTILNGSFWIFWITICVPLAFELKEIMFAGQYLFLFFFEAGWLIATLLVVFIFSRFKFIFSNQKTILILYRLMALILACYSVRIIINGVQNSI